MVRSSVNKPAHRPKQPVLAQAFSNAVPVSPKRMCRAAVGARGTGACSRVAAMHTWELHWSNRQQNGPTKSRLPTTAAQWWNCPRRRRPHQGVCPANGANARPGRPRGWGNGSVQVEPAAVLQAPVGSVRHPACSGRCQLAGMCTGCLARARAAQQRSAKARREASAFAQVAGMPFHVMSSV